MYARLVLGERAAKTFFGEQGIGFEGATKVANFAGRGGIDLPLAAPCNVAMAPARTVNESASLEERLGIAGIEHSNTHEAEILGTGVDSLDEALEGGLRAGVLTELAAPLPSSGGQTLMLHLLEQARQAQRFAALVDGGDAFDPQSTPPALLEHLLWARCRSPLEAMKVADVLLRDENLGMVLVDLRWCDARELLRVKSADWYKLQRLAERTSACVCVFTPKAMIPSAQVRVSLGNSLSLEQAEASMAEKSAEMSFEVSRLRQQSSEEFPNLIQRVVG